ncbi:MAG: hypothetical protein LBI10_03640 [Deltaproteobacteria bacterium]|jgi:hypothetical protein|nr:hypothetical protein [Deltaproteobacteria bacterium]
MAKSLEPLGRRANHGRESGLRPGLGDGYGYYIQPRTDRALEKDLTLKVQGAGRPWWALTVSGGPTLAPEPIASGLKVAKT